MSRNDDSRVRRRVRHEVQRLRENSEWFTVCHINFSINPREMEALSSALMDHNTHLEVLRLQDCFRRSPDSGYTHSSFEAAVVTFLTSILGRDHPSLETISFWGNHDMNIDDKRAKVIADALRSNTSLKDLQLIGNQIGPAGAAALAETLQNGLSSLNTFSLSCNPIGDEGVKAIAAGMCANTTTTRLDLRRCNIADEGCKDLIKMLFVNNRLRVLVLAHTHLTDSMQRTLHEMLGRNRDSYLNIRSNMARIPLSHWPKALEQVALAPDYLFHILKIKPDLCREPDNRRKRQRR